MKTTPNSTTKDIHSLDVLGIVGLGAALSRPTQGDGIIPFSTVLTERDETKQVSLEHLLTRPSIVRANVTVRDVESFVAYIEKYRSGSPEAKPAIFASVTEIGAEFTAILDYHHNGSATPEWGVHRCVFTCTETVEWTRWMRQNKQAMNQEVFARFIEDNAPDFVNPSSSWMQEMALTLEARQTGEFANAVRLQNGTFSLRYSETIDAKAGANGDQEIPATFEIGIAPFVGFAPWKVEARLRFKLSGGKLTFWYELVRPHKIIEEAAKEVIKSITAGVGMVPFRGNVQSMGASATR